MAENRPPEQVGEEQKEHFFVTKASQQNQAPTHRKFSYTGTRDLTDIENIKELDIIAEDGTIRGMKNRVRAGQAHFDNPVALAKKREEQGKVIVYVTSFRGVRSVNEDCRYVLTVLHNFLVRVEERDIYVNKYYYHELQERLQSEAKVPIPQVFISGQHIGGKEELETLNETGELRNILAEIPRTKVTLTCKTCGGYKFIPCLKCGGSKNSMKNNFTWEFKALKCTGCNENGLQPCPDCETRQEESEEDKQHREKLKEYERQQKLKKERAEAEQLRKMEEERKAQQRAKKKEEKERKAREKRERKEKARKLREKQAIMEAARQRIMADISGEIEKEKAWKRAHGLPVEDEENSAEIQESSDEDSSEESSGSTQDVNNQDTGNQDTKEQDTDIQDKEDQVTDDQDKDEVTDDQNKDEVTDDQEKEDQEATINQESAGDQKSDQSIEAQTPNECLQNSQDKEEASDNKKRESDPETEDEGSYIHTMDMENEAVTNF